MKKLLAISRAAKAAQEAENSCSYVDLTKSRVEGLQNCFTAVQEDVATLASAKSVEVKTTKK